MRIDFSKIKTKETLNYQGDIAYFNSAANIKAIKAYKDINGLVTVEKADSVIVIKYDINAVLTVYSTLSGEPFDYPLEISETLYYSDDKDMESEDVFFVPEGYIDLNEEIYSLIIASLPLVLHKEGEEYPKGENYRVLSEDDLIKEDEDISNSPFDKLKDLDL